MAKERDWFDYGILAGNLFQNIQLDGVQDKLSGMASIAASEQAKAIQQDALREVVFRADTNLKSLRAHLDDDKTGVLVLARFTLAQFKQRSLTSASFRSFEDKERFRTVLEGFRSLIDECVAALPPDELEEAEQRATLMLGGDEGVPAGVRSSVMVFGKHMPPSGAVFYDLDDMLSSLQRFGIVKGLQCEATIDELIRKGYTIIHKKAPRDFTVYAQQFSLNPDTAAEVQRYLGIGDDTPMVYKRHGGDSTGSAITWQYLL